VPLRSLSPATLAALTLLLNATKAATHFQPTQSRDMNNSSINGAQGQGYPQDGSGYAVDPSLLNESPWALPADQYAHHDNFTPQQSIPQYANHATSYGGYAVSQGSPYSLPPYTSAYGPQYQHSGHLDHYPLSQFGHPASQGPSVSQPSYATGNGNFPYTTFGQETATISPHALHKTDLNINQPQKTLKSNEVQQTIDPNSTFQHNWDHNAARQYQPQSAINSIGTYVQQGPTAGDIYPSLNAGFPGSSGQALGLQAQGVDASKHAVVRKPKSTIRQSTLRITNPDLLAATENNPSRRLSYAPYLVIGEHPIELEVIGKGQFL
jgi:hypothetical protein